MIMRDTRGITMLGDRRLPPGSVPDIIKKIEFSNFDKFVLTFYNIHPHQVMPCVPWCTPVLPSISLMHTVDGETAY